MKITNSKNEVLFNAFEIKVHDFWPFKLMNAITGNYYGWMYTNIKGVFEVVNSLFDNEKSIILMRFQDDLTYREIGEKFNVSMDRGRQLVNKILWKLRRPDMFNKIKAVSRAELAAMKMELIASSKIPDVSIEELGLSIRTFNSLKRGGLNTLHDIAAKTKTELMNFRLFGKSSLNEVIDKLNEYGITLKDE